MTDVRLGSWVAKVFALAFALDFAKPPAELAGTLPLVAELFGPAFASGFLPVDGALFALGAIAELAACGRPLLVARMSSACGEEG